MDVSEDGAPGNVELCLSDCHNKTPRHTWCTAWPGRDFVRCSDHLGAEVCTGQDSLVADHAFPAFPSD